MKSVLRRIIPKSVISRYHRLLGKLGAFVYRHPSRKMIVIGITGTKGKSTTANILWKILTDAGFTVGLTGTANYRIGNQHLVSPYKMTMLGRFQLHWWLARMVKAGCNVAIVETTSEGVAQWRHESIAYDICALTNLFPEHLESHGGFENYKQAKLELFRHLARLPKKRIDGKEVPRASVVNADNEHAEDFLSIGDFEKVRVGSAAENDVVIASVDERTDGTSFTLSGQKVDMPLLGAWNAKNALVAAGIARVLDVSLEQIATALSDVEQVPGRMERIDEGQPFTVIVDYAYEPESLGLLYAFFADRRTDGQKLITLISSTGGGRDVGRRKPNGAVAAKMCDYVIVTDEDPYDDDPQEIIDQVAEGAREAGAVEGENMWRVRDRREAIAKAFSLAQPGDVVFLTAKGSEQKMMVGQTESIDWDDRKVARDLLKSS